MAAPWHSEHGASHISHTPARSNRPLEHEDIHTPSSRSMSATHRVQLVLEIAHSAHVSLQREQAPC